MEIPRVKELKYFGYITFITVKQTLNYGILADPLSVTIKIERESRELRM